LQRFAPRCKQTAALREFSPLRFQADIGIMLTCMFLVSMLAVIILLPALPAWLIHPQGLKSVTRSPGLRRHPVDQPTTRTAEHQPREPRQQQIHADEKPNRPD
jgi:hypothetical protein